MKAFVDVSREGREFWKFFWLELGKWFTWEKALPGKTVEGQEKTMQANYKMNFFIDDIFQSKSSSH